MYKAFCNALMVCCILFSLPAYSATYYSRTSGTFNTPGTWSVNPGGFPTNGATLANGDIFIIQNNHTVTMNATRTIGQLTINSGGTLAFQTYTLTISGNCLNNGTMSGSTGQITVNTSTFTNNGTFTYTSGRINQTTGDLINSGSITGTSGRITHTSGDLNNTSTGTILFTATAVITLGTGNLVNANSSASVDFGSAAITISGTAATQSIGGFVTDGRVSCTKTSGIATFTGDVTSNGLTMNGAGTLDLGVGLNHTTIGTVILTSGTLNGGSSTLNVNVVSTSAWGGSNAAVFVPGTGTVNLGAAGAQRLSASGTKTFYNLTFSNSGLKTVVVTTNVTNVFSIEGSATASAAPAYGASASLRYNTATPRTAGVEWITPFAATGGVIIDNTGTISANGNKVFNEGVPLTINTGATFNAGSNDLTFNGDFINNGTWTASAGDVTISGAVGQDIGGFTTSGQVLIAKTNGTAILQGDVNGGAFTMNSSGGILRLGSGHTHTFTGTWTNTDGTLRCNTSTLNIAGAISGSAITFTPNNGTVNFTGAMAQAIPAFNYNNIGFSGAGIKTLTGTTTVDEVLTIQPASELDLGTYTLNLGGAGTPLVNNGVFTAGTSTVNYTNATSATIAAVDYYNLDGSGGDRTFATTGDIGIGGSFTPGSGNYTVTNSTVDFNSSGIQTIPAFTFYNLKVSNAGIKHILASTKVVCQAIDINDDASVEINADGGGKLDVVQ
ncbi:hypothetical protein GWC95_10290 [Sediminibacterium roseum]|uniref:Autotransporter-associated beta strand repeat-containing protein n=1 Tax=Sediminibacterium roseum TaxID=1978412 RepID=A0ABW9ZT69_9BACT|nr:hypothetical protein [Sediminibacterium roseum]NCI50311.1 hypothetical protein [Sediminibacterium roseum]